MKPAGDEFVDQYATDVFTKEAVNIIKSHDRKTPLFLELSHVAVHALKGNILQVRDEKKNDEDFKYIADQQRRRLAGIHQALDESVGKVIEALKETDLLENSVVLFMSDNGGATEDPMWNFENSASNWPLRGVDEDFFSRRGVRGAAAIWSPLFARRNYVSDELFHITDWLPTFVSAAGGDSGAIENIDGINQWNLLTGKQQKSIGTYEPSFADNYAGASGRGETPPYDINSVLTSPTNRLINRDSITGDKFLEIRAQAKLDPKCQLRISTTSNLDTKCLRDCLYDLETDPCEFENKAVENPEVVTKLRNRLTYYENITMSQQRPIADVNADPSRWGGYWSPWLDE
ncbi:N-acetylgalactosamine-4-sulfatase, partial [Sarracenia purpurea var. burkii]